MAAGWGVASAQSSSSGAEGASRKEASDRQGQLPHSSVRSPPRSSVHGVSLSGHAGKAETPLPSLTDCLNLSVLLDLTSDALFSSRFL